MGRFDAVSSVSLLPLSESIRKLDNLPNTAGNDLNLFSLRNRISSVCRASILGGRVELRMQYIMKRNEVMRSL